MSLYFLKKRRTWTIVTFVTSCQFLEYDKTNTNCRTHPTHLFLDKSRIENAMELKYSIMQVGFIIVSVSRVLQPLIRGDDETVPGNENSLARRRFLGNDNNGKTLVRFSTRWTMAPAANTKVKYEGADKGCIDRRGRTRRRVRVAEGRRVRRVKRTKERTK